MLTVVLPAPGIITAYIQTDEVGAPVEDKLVVGWDESGEIVIAETNGVLRSIAANETVREIVWV